jgi:transposase
MCSEDAGFELLLVNARHVKQLPGRKTDVTDACWLAELLECGLLAGSFVPPPVIGELRDVTRYRKRLVQMRTREAARVDKVLGGRGDQARLGRFADVGRLVSGDDRGADRG